MSIVILFVSPSRRDASAGEVESDPISLFVFRQDLQD